MTDDKQALIKWDDRSKLQTEWNRFVRNGIECPKCGKELYDDTSMTLSSYPAQIPVWCFDECDFRGAR